MSHPAILRFFAAFMALLLAAASAAGEALWIDVRTPEEYRTDHLAGAINIPHDVIGERIEKVTTDRDATIYLYCRSGNRSGQAQETLEELGYSRATSVGGLEDARKISAELAVE